MLVEFSEMSRASLNKYVIPNAKLNSENSANVNQTISRTCSTDSEILEDKTDSYNGKWWTPKEMFMKTWKNKPAKFAKLKNTDVNNNASLKNYRDEKNDD